MSTSALGRNYDYREVSSQTGARGALAAGDDPPTDDPLSDPERGQQSEPRGDPHRVRPPRQSRAAGVGERSAFDQLEVPLDRGRERVVERARPVAELVARLARAEPPVLAHQVRSLRRQRARQADRLTDASESLDGSREHHDRVADAGKLGDAVDELGPAEIDTTEDVTVAGLAPVGGQEL